MKPHRLPTLLAIAIISVPAVSLSATKHVTKHYGSNAPFKITDLPEGLVKAKLTGLAAAKQQIALNWLHKMNFTDDDLKYIKVDDNGAVLYADSFLPASGATAPVQMATTISTTDAFTLHSKPGATKIIYLDFDGHVITGTAWNSTVSTYNAKAFDTDSNIAAFGPTELSQIAEIWHRIAEDYAPFNVDVTTELPASFGPTVGRILITNNVDANGVQMPAFGAGGVAYVGVWGASNYSYYSPALVYYNALGGGFAPYVSEAASHEMGHNLGLSHDGFNDGTTSLGYYAGNGIGFVSWAPIMGVGYYNNVTQWSQGEYAFATQTQDDIGIIAGSLTLRTDDHGNTLAGATPLLVSATGQITSTNPETDPHNTGSSNKGIIESRTDVDYFSFNAGVGPLQITINPAWAAFQRADKRGANLDIQATLYDQAGTQIAQTDPVDDTTATISASITTDGQYYLVISGVGNSVAPYSDYGSLGEYFINGAVTPSNIVPDTTAPTPNPMAWDVLPNAGTNTNSISMTATPATDEGGGDVQYLFACVSGSQGCINSNWQTSNQYTATGLAAGTTYNYQVKAKDASGNETDYSNTATATTAAAPADAIAPTPNPMTWSVKPAAVSSSSIRMKATVAKDNSGIAVQYMFVCTTSGTSCTNSNWQTSNQYTASGLAVATAYTFQVKARDTSGNETTLSANASATTKNAIPLTPTNLSGIRKTTTSVALTWNKVNNASSYEVWRCTVVGTTCNYGSKRYASVTTNAYSGSAPTGTVRYKVNAANSLGKSGYSNELSL
jgi:Metallo-peptidase family M12B Reprolysin-like